MSLFTDLLVSPDAAKYYLAILEPLDPDLPSGGDLTLYYSTQGFISEPSDSPANTEFPGRIVRAINFTRSMWQGGQVGGRSIPGFGELVLANSDGELDDLTDYVWASKRVRIYMGGENFTFADYGLIFDGTSDGVEARTDQIAVRLRDYQYKLSDGVLRHRFAGTGGAEGNSAITGRLKPRAYGRAANVTPAVLDAAAGYYMAAEGLIEDVDVVYVDGVAKTKTAGAPGAGQYRVTVGSGLIEMGDTTPIQGQVTCDVKGRRDGSAYLQSVAEITYDVLTEAAEIEPSSIDLAALSALDAKNNSLVGIFIGEDRPVIEVLDDLFGTIGGFFGFTRAGIFTCGRFEAPTGTAAAAFTSDDLLELSREPQPHPIYEVEVKWGANWTVQVSFASGVTGGLVDFVARDFRSAVRSASAVRDVYPHADRLEVKALFWDSTPAGDEAARLLALYREPRMVLRARVKVQPFVLDLNDVVTITHSRFGLDAGRDFRIISLTEDSSVNEVDMILWG